jgi:Glycosyl transferases group 1
MSGPPPSAPDLSQLRFIEIGGPYIKYAFPEQTHCFSSWPMENIAGLPSPSGGGLEPSWRLPRLLADPGIAVIVCHPTMFAPWHPSWFIRAIFSRRFLRAGLPLTSGWGPQLLRRRLAAPIAVLDREDLPVINRNNLFLLDRATAYFKRELPSDRWKVFVKTGHHGVPTPRYRMVRRHRRRVETLLPISLGLKLGSQRFFPPATEKSVDVFFAGRIEGSSTVRKQGLAELLALRDQGVTLDIPQGNLPLGEFYRRAAAARLVWSPEGFGWDCFRHYEAPMCGSVPLINNPAIERYRPLIGGKHAIYYDIEPGGLTRAVLAALADRDRLAAMAAEAKIFVELHHTPTAIARHVLEATLARRPLASELPNSRTSRKPGNN